MHILDLIMWFVVMGISWAIIDWMSDGEFVEEIGGIIGLIILAIITVCYVILFVFIDYNWIDIFNEMYNANFNQRFKL